MKNGEGTRKTMKEKKYFADTSFLIDLFRGEKKAKNIRKGNRIVTGIITLYELSKISDFNRSKLERNTVMPLKPSDVKKAAELYRRLDARDEKVGELDYLIAGQAMNRDLILVTRDQHFKRFEKLETRFYRT